VVASNTPCFTVAAQGTAPLSFQWSFNTTNCPVATNATLILSNVQLAQAGSYSVLVSNLAGSVARSNAVLTVLASPACTPPPAGLVSWWPAEGNGNDSIGGNNAALPASGITFGNARSPGPVSISNASTNTLMASNSPALTRRRAGFLHRDVDQPLAAPGNSPPDEMTIAYKRLCT